MTEYSGPDQTPSKSDLPPPPPLPPPSGGGSRTLLLAIAAAVVIAVAVVFVMPLIFGANPIDVLSGKEKVTVQTEEVRTVEERVVTAGQEAVVEVANKLLPSVVYIEVTFGDSAFGFETTGIGSGIIYSTDGYIVTNNHVVEGASDIRVAIADGSTYDAELIGRDPETDLAVIKIDCCELPAAELGTSSDLVVGELAVAIGSPEGFEQSVTSGIISALNRNVFMPDGGALLDVIQTDTAINPGNSGGPLSNSVGEVVGINTAIVSISGGYDGIGFAIAIDNAKPVIEEIIATGSATHPWLGFTGRTLDPAVVERYDLPVDSGAIVVEIVPGTPAEEAGLEAGDIITAIDGAEVESMDQLVVELRKKKIGDTVTIEFYRGDEMIQSQATLEEKPEM